MKIEAFLIDLAALPVAELFGRYQLTVQPDPNLMRSCKEPLLSLGTLEHSAWEQAHNYGSTLVRLGICEKQRVLFHHKRSLYATRTSGCRYREELTNHYAALNPDGLAELAAKPKPTDPELAWAFELAERKDDRWLRSLEGGFEGFRNAERLYAVLEKDTRDCRCFRLSSDLEQQGPGISRDEFLMRMQPGPTFGFFE